MNQAFCTYAALFESASFPAGNESWEPYIPAAQPPLAGGGFIVSTHWYVILVRRLPDPFPFTGNRDGKSKLSVH